LIAAHRPLVPLLDDLAGTLRLCSSILSRAASE